jgi:Leucine-rich repeat (LRR) protein
MLFAAITTQMGCPGSQVVTFADPNLELAVRLELREFFGFITRADMARLVSLDGRNFGIRDLRGLEEARNLEFLDVSNDQLLANAITNMSPLANLVNLRFLNLENHDVSDITAVAGLFNLDELRLAGNEVFNIRPLLANAENGGLGPGDTVTLTRQSLVDADGNLVPEIATQINRLVELGISVILIEV